MFYTRKPEPSNVRGVCTVIGCNNQQKSKGGGRYRSKCYKHCAPVSSDKRRRDKAKYGSEGTKHLRKTYCEWCGPDVPYHFSQLEIDHIHGRAAGNGIANLQTLCGSCHNYKTWYTREHGVNLY